MIDLHLHSTHSDGTLQPAELVTMAFKKRLAAISITDHDTVSGTEEAREESSKSGVQVISGVELSVFRDKKYFHLLGYGFDWKDENLIRGLEVLQNSRRKRNARILEILQGKGISISMDDLRDISGAGQIGRPHFARILVSKGVVKTIDQAFERYLKKGAPAYVSRFIYPVEQAIKMIKSAGGITSLAHPVQLGYSLEVLKGMLSGLKDSGLDALETYYPTQKGKIRKKLSELARHYELLETGGSDYHGDIRINTSMAGGHDFFVPGQLLERLEKHLAKSGSLKK